MATQVDGTLGHPEGTRASDRVLPGVRGSMTGSEEAPDSPFLDLEPAGPSNASSDVDASQDPVSPSRRDLARQIGVLLRTLLRDLVRGPARGA